MKSCYHCASLHCPPTPFIVFLMLYKYNTLKKQKRVLPPNEISSNYQGCIILCMLCFVDECSSTELSVGVFVGSLVALFHSYSCCFNISSDDHLSTNQTFV